MGEVMMGHLRYGTHGKTMCSVCTFIREQLDDPQPGHRRKLQYGEQPRSVPAACRSWPAPKEFTDTITVLEKLGHFLDREVQQLFDQYKPYRENQKISELIAS